MHVRTIAGLTGGLTALALASAVLSTPAGADTGAQGGDVVAVGSDTAQNAVDFAFDGSPGVTGGYNFAGNKNRAVNVDATGDANGRATYDPNGNTLAASVVLRAGTKPVIRPNGSGGGIAALNLDAPGAAGYDGLANGSIQIARASRLPNSGEISNCSTTSPCGGLHVFQMATDTLGIAHQTSSYNGPAALSDSELVDIYNCNITKWNQLPGNSSGSSATIHPLIPQTGSGTRNFFLADIAATSGKTVNLGSCVRTVQEHDPTGIYTDPSPADAIEPFSAGKITLLNSGYFDSGVTGSSSAAYAAKYLSFTNQAGTAGDGKGVYVSTRGIYLVVRQSDFVSTTPFQAGSPLTFVQALITSGASAIRSAGGQAQLQAAGFVTTGTTSGHANGYIDCGINPTSC